MFLHVIICAECFFTDGTNERLFLFRIVVRFLMFFDTVFTIENFMANIAIYYVRHWLFFQFSVRQWVHDLNVLLVMVRIRRGKLRCHLDSGWRFTKLSLKKVKVCYAYVCAGFLNTLVS